MIKYCWECSRPIAKGHRHDMREIATGENVLMHFKCAHAFDLRNEHYAVYSGKSEDMPKGVAPSDKKGAKK